MQFRLTRFEVEESFGKWQIHISGELIINGIKTRVNDYFKVNDFRKEFKKTVDIFDLTFNQIENLATNYYTEKVRGNAVGNDLIIKE